MMTVPSENYGGNIDYISKYLTFEALESGIFQFTNNIQYSLDNGTTWVNLAANTPSPLINPGNKICWSYTVLPSSSGYSVGTFSSSGRFNVEGNVMSMAYGNNFIGQTSLNGKDDIFYGLFAGCIKLISAENMLLPATILAANCYDSMFNNCTSLTTTPSILPAITLAINCYQGMFLGCTSLITAPQLPATTLANYCYSYMFQGCTSLTTAPALPATTLTDGCYYNMFSNCTNLTTAPELLATILVEDCYSQMFNNCSNLNYIKCLATGIITSSNTWYWTNNVASNGTFYRNQTQSSSWPVGINGIPNGWTVI